ESRLDRDAGLAEHLHGPLGARRDPTVDDVVGPGDRVLAEQLDDALGEVGRLGRRAELVPDKPERLAGLPRPAGRGEDLGRKVVPGRTEQPGGADDPEGARGAREGRPGALLGGEL